MELPHPRLQTAAVSAGAGSCYGFSESACLELVGFLSLRVRSAGCCFGAERGLGVSLLQVHYRTHSPSSPSLRTAGVVETQCFRAPSKLQQRIRVKSPSPLGVPLSKAGSGAGMSAGLSDKPVQACDAAVICPAGWR